MFHRAKAGRLKTVLWMAWGVLLDKKPCSKGSTGDNYTSAITCLQLPYVDVRLADTSTCCGFAAGEESGIQMRCPYCQGLEDKVVDSRLGDEGAAIRRRRECLECGHRFTTFERVDEITLWVIKRGGDREVFDLEKVSAGIQMACKNRPIDGTMIATLADEVEEGLRSASGAEVTSREVGEAILQRLAEIDEVAYLRFASVYLRFDGLTDFAREVGRLRRLSPART